jgi:rhomboid protease GluP
MNARSVQHITAVQCRLVTSAFLHDSFSHLMLNTYALYTVAPEVEAVLGHWTFLSVYLLSGLAGSSAAFVFGDTITVGASTCIFGLIGNSLSHCQTTLQL